MWRPQTHKSPFLYICVSSSCSCSLSNNSFTGYPCTLASLTSNTYYLDVVQAYREPVLYSEPIMLKIKTMPFGQNWSRCRPHNAVSTALPFITHNLLPLCCDSRYIYAALTYKSDIYSPLQCHPTFTLLPNVMLISAPFL